MQGFTRRADVPDDAARAVLQRLRRSGELELVMNVILDHGDWLERALRGKLRAELLADARALAGFNAVQGAASEVDRLARILWALSDPRETAPVKALRGKEPAPMRTDV